MQAVVNAAKDTWEWRDEVIRIMMNAQMGDGGQDLSGAPADRGAAPPQPPGSDTGRRGPNWLLIGGIIMVAMIFLGGMVIMIVAIGALASDRDATFSGFGERVGVITISGVITSAGTETLFGGRVGGARATMRQLRRAAEDDSIKAVVLRINSPGGSPAASQEIYREVARLAEEKPVVVSMGDVAASGGYYVASPAQRIVANGSSVTGSIGVQMAYMQYFELMEKIGLEGGVLTTGPYKDTGSPLREMREDERALLQGILDDMYDQFVRDVAEGRGMDDESVRELANGRIFTGEQAVEAGLVDELGNFHHAVEIAGELGGIVGEPRIRDMHTPTGVFDLFGVLSRSAWQTAIERLLYDERLEGIEGLMQLGR